MVDDDTSGAATGRPASLGPSSPSDDVPRAKGFTCACGHDRSHYLVSPVPTYTGWGKFWVIFMGVSTQPVRVDFKCRQCGRTFDFTEDADELRQFL